MLGRKPAAMTLDTYADLFDDDLDEVALRLNEGGHQKVWAKRGHEEPNRLAEERAKAPTSAQSRGSRGPRSLVRMAENGGFEPPRACTQHAFQACAIGH